MDRNLVLSFALLALSVWFVVLPVALYCLLGAEPVRRGGRAAVSLFAGTAIIPALLLAATLLTARIAAGGWLEALAVR